MLLIKCKIFLIIVFSSLILGRLHTIMSRSMYLQVWSSFSMCDVVLPHWESIRIMMARLHELLKLTMIENFSFLNTKCFYLSIKYILRHELANPLVQAHLNFYPHETYGKNAFASYQIQIRRENNTIVVPTFFYSHQYMIYAKCFNPQIIKVDSKHSQTVSNVIKFLAHIDYHSSMLEDILVSEFVCCGGHIVILHTQSLRTKARGKLIYHMPINLYADDMSGNKSKRWNKHISFYFTFSGLSPKMDYVEYNRHLISTSNVAEVLEIAESIMNTLLSDPNKYLNSDLTTNGCIGYDPMIQQEVLITSMPLCFMAPNSC
ncbi:hypothetical protein VP01_395g5 [Puccinia sorghi]|uniref:Uncharacterized protein n=1 Tax=Puccinia sorghi TaxID=27349 RepID=A0A0L6USF4_9BASI|nr:hypothetical protein VP01_395g5 [Puccinia sorghi]